MQATYNKKLGYYVKFDPKRHNATTVHQLVAEKKLHRRLKPNELVHHLDHNKLNDRASNLKVVNKSQHNKLHKVWQGKNNPSAQMTHAERSRLSKQGWKHRH